MAYWKDNADSYLCSACGFECDNPNKLKFGTGRCPKCKSLMGLRTNADRIRAMSDEELVMLLCCTGWIMTEQRECLAWLKQPAEGDK